MFSTASEYMLSVPNYCIEMAWDSRSTIWCYRWNYRPLEFLLNC